MKPILYNETETLFTTNGIGKLTDAISCTVEEERNGSYELEMEYPIDGILYDEIALRKIILAYVGDETQTQPFRIYEITKPHSGTVTVYAQHIAYDLAGVPITAYTAANVSEALSGINTHAACECKFSFTTDKETVANMKVTKPIEAWNLLGGTAGGVLDSYGGEYEFDRYNVKLLAHRGSDRGFTIRYGKNLTSLEQEENCANVYTGVYPYWVDMDDNLVELPERIVTVDGTYSYERVYLLDLSATFEEAPTAAQMRSKTQSYIEGNNIGVPEVQLTVSFAQLQELKSIEKIKLCDTVTVEFPKLGVSAKSKCVKTKYDCLKERYTEIELGTIKRTLGRTLAKQEQTADNVSVLLNGQIVKSAADMLTKANEYTDTQDAVVTEYVDTQDTATYNSATDYADTQDLTYLAESKSYSDSGDASTLVACKKFANDQISNFDDALNQEKIFNKLTNNGKTQGIYLSNGLLYINGTYIRTGVLDAQYVEVSGGLVVYKASNNPTKVGTIGFLEGNNGIANTNGTGLSSANENSYVIVTDSGVRLTANGYDMYITSGGVAKITCNKLTVDGDLKVTGTIDGTLSS